MMYVSQIIMLYTLNLYSAVCQLYLNKTGRREKRKRISWDIKDGARTWSKRLEKQKKGDDRTLLGEVRMGWSCSEVNQWGMEARHSKMDLLCWAWRNPFLHLPQEIQVTSKCFSPTELSGEQKLVWNSCGGCQEGDNQHFGHMMAKGELRFTGAGLWFRKDDYHGQTLQFLYWLLKIWYYQFPPKCHIK